MLKRTLGDGAPSLSVLGLGCSRIGSFGNPASVREIHDLFERCIQLGVTLFDTSNVYGQGDSERAIGGALKGRREAGFVVTKLGKSFSAKARLVRPLKPLVKALLPLRGRRSITSRREGNVGWSLRPNEVGPTLDASLRRLRFDHVDGLLLHSPPASVACDPEIADALASLRLAGKVGHYGVSCDDFSVLEAALKMPGLSLLQLPPPVLEEAAANGLADQFAERGIAVMLRQVIQLQPGLPPPQAVRRAAMIPRVTSVVVGVSNASRLEELVAACRDLEA